MGNRVLLICSLMMGVGFNPSSFSAEEQVVIDDLSVRELRAEIEKIQNEVFRIFNLSNTDDSLDVICHEYTPAMTLIPQKACEPNFLIDARSENVVNYQRDLEDLMTPEQLRSDNQAGFIRLTEAMNEVMRSNDYFRELNTILRVLRERLEELTE